MTEGVPGPLARTALCIHWKSPEIIARGEIDLFRPDEFAVECKGDSREHEVRIRKWRGYALYALSVRGKAAVLDYTVDGEVNHARGIELGVMRLRFSDSARSTLEHATWTRKGGREKELKFELVTETVDAVEAYAGPGRAQKRFRTQRVQARDGQLVFRNHVLDTYGGTCCVTGCTIAPTLEAAHIDPYNGPPTHHPANGLLLRADLHKLFDARLLAIDPKRLTVWIHPDVEANRDYAALQGRPIALPAGAYSRFAPDPNALARRWKERRLPTV
jgi:hypothetical protein